VRAQDRFSQRGIEAAIVDGAGQPGGLGAQLLVAHLGIAAAELGHHQPRDGTAGHDADEQQPDVELRGHQAIRPARAQLVIVWRIAHGRTRRSRYTSPTCPPSPPSSSQSSR
jgi:hypothetical protein